MQTLQVLSCNFRKSRSGTALVGALVMIGIIAMIVGVMLSTTRNAIQSSRDKILFEEAYQCAVSGTHVARGFLLDPELASDMTGNGSIESDLEKIMAAARQMSSDIIESNYSLANLPPDQVKSKWFGSIGGSTPLSDGRYVLYTFPKKAGKIVAFNNDPDNKEFTGSLFQDGTTNDNKSFVDLVRITTIGTSNETSCSLRETSFIIEARGRAEYAGGKKQRVVQQRVLVFPNEAPPLLSADEAILTQAGLKIGGSSHINIHWGSVLARQNLELLGMKLTKPTEPGVPWTLAPSDETYKKYNGAGTYTYNLPDFSGTEVLDKWLTFETGVGGKLMAGSGSEQLFKDITLADGQQIVDFFAQLANGEFATLNPGLTADEIQLAGKYAAAGTSLDQESDYHGLLYEQENGSLQGGLIQGAQAVDDSVNEFFDTNSYEKLKAYATDHNGYVRVTDNGFVNAMGNPIYVNPATRQMSDVKQGASWKQLTDLKQISMEGLIPENYDPVVDGSVDDRILFIDSQGQSPDSPIPGSVNIDASFFWKGIVYVNGNLDSAGAGNSPILTLRTPEEYSNLSLPGHPVGSMLMDGILIANGTITSRGNMSIYGTLAGKGTIDLGGNPSVFYNSANGAGRLQDTSGVTSDVRLVAGRMYEPETQFIN